MDRIDAMRTFITVVNEGAFSRAAERLEMSPQLVSKYVSQLEQRLGVRLLNRTTRKVHLTEAGSRYFERAQQLLDDMDDLENQLDDWQDGAQGTLKITAPVSFATQHLAPLLCDFQRENPNVSIDVQLNDRKVDIVQEGFDVALRIGHLKNSSLIARRIAPVRLVTCASPAYLDQHGRPQTLQQLRQHRYLRYSYMDADTGTAQHAELFAGRHQHADLVSNNGDILVQAAIAGAGIAVQPSFICGKAIAEGKLEVLLADQEPEPMNLYAVYAHRQFLASKVRRFIDFLSTYYGEVPYWDAYSNG